jgi:hypothetical protein
MFIVVQYCENNLELTLNYPRNWGNLKNCGNLSSMKLSFQESISKYNI